MPHKFGRYFEMGSENNGLSIDFYPENKKYQATALWFWS
jgi:hypothetical protein